MALAILLSLSGVLGISLRDPGEKLESLSLRPLLKPAQIVGVTLAYILALEWGGFVLTTFLYLFILFAWISRYRLPAALGMAAAFSAGGWVLFAKVLGLLLPRSFLGV